MFSRYRSSCKFTSFNKNSSQKSNDDREIETNHLLIVIKAQGYMHFDRWCFDVKTVWGKDARSMQSCNGYWALQFIGGRRSLQYLSSRTWEEELFESTVDARKALIWTGCCFIRIRRIFLTSIASCRNFLRCRQLETFHITTFPCFRSTHGDKTPKS